jgi:SAM-dependent methyltransferase
MSKLTDAEIAAMPPKSVRYPEEVKLYQENDFLSAYALHTDKRIAETSYMHAIGGGDNWELHGELQRAFLIQRGLKHTHWFLDVGCGTGRLARKVVPYLSGGTYVGLDISHEALRAAVQLSEDEGWRSYMPTFVHGDLPHGMGPFNFAWAFSVFIHLPFDICVDVMRRVAASLEPNGQFLFSYVPEERSWRSGLKQFRHTLEDTQRMCADAGLSFEDVPNWIERSGYTPGRVTGSQRIGCARRKA